MQTMERAAPTNRVAGTPAYKRAEIAQRLSELAGRCAEVAAEIHEERRLERIAAISEWCVEQAERLAQDRFGTCEQADFAADVASVAWELTELSGGKWPPNIVIRIARRMVKDGRHFEVSTTTVERHGDRIEVDPDFDLDIWPDHRAASRIAIFRMDFRDWLETLSPLAAAIASRLSNGSLPSEVCEELELHWRDFTDWRKALWLRWKDFHQN